MKRYSTQTAYEVQVSDEFRDWYEPLSESEQDDISRVVGLLEQRGPALPYPYSSGIQGSTLSSCGYSTEGVLIVFSMPSIQLAQLIC